MTGTVPFQSANYFYEFRQRIRDLMSRAVEERNDWITPFCMLSLAASGVFFIYSAQSYNDGTDWQKQILWIFCGALTYLIVSALNYKLFLQSGHWLYALSICLLFPLALEGALRIDLPRILTLYGSTRWIDLGIMRLQPSELAKIGTLILLSSILARSEVGDLRDSITALIKVSIAFFIPFLLIFLQPDLGSCLVFVPMTFALLYVSRLSQRFFLTVLGLFTLATLIASVDIYHYYQFLKDNNISATENQSVNAYGSEHSLLPLHDYQRNRILSFVAPDVVDPQGIGVSWNRNQALIAAGSGGLWGKGHGEGTQAKLGYLPRSVATNDFILSVLLEEKGFIGGIIVITLYAIILGNTLRIAGLARDRFGMLITVGVSVIFIVHVFINIGMAVGMMPITGLPLPFVSYGGSFIIVCCFLQGLVQSVYRFRRDFS